jgi:hypothetical protein
VEGPIMQAKECTGAFGRCNKWSTWAQRSQRGDDRAGRKPSQGGARSHSPTNSIPWCSSSAVKQLSPSSICVLKFLCPEPS